MHQWEWMWGGIWMVCWIFYCSTTFTPHASFLLSRCCRILLHHTPLPVSFKISSRAATLHMALAQILSAGFRAHAPYSFCACSFLFCLCWLWSPLQSWVQHRFRTKTHIHFVYFNTDSKTFHFHKPILFPINTPKQNEEDNCSLSARQTWHPEFLFVASVENLSAALGWLRGSMTATINVYFMHCSHLPAETASCIQRPNAANCSNPIENQFPAGSPLR